MAKKKKNVQKPKSSVNGIKPKTKSSDTEWFHIFPRPVDREYEVVNDPYFSTNKGNKPKKKPKITTSSKARDLYDSLSNRGWLSLVICIGLFALEWIDASRYVEIPATVMGVSVKTRAVPIFGSKYHGGGTTYVNEKWVEVQYNFDNAEYNAKILMYSELTSAHKMIFCNKKHPSKCRSTKIKYPLANMFLILVTFMVLSYMFGIELLESIFKSEFVSVMILSVMFVGLLAYFYYRYLHL